jgi:hypothetical protein
LPVFAYRLVQTIPLAHVTELRLRSEELVRLFVIFGVTSMHGLVDQKRDKSAAYKSSLVSPPTHVVNVGARFMLKDESLERSNTVQQERAYTIGYSECPL